jgi:hypothetical protein
MLAGATLSVNVLIVSLRKVLLVVHVRRRCIVPSFVESARKDQYLYANASALCILGMPALK